MAEKTQQQEDVLWKIRGRQQGEQPRRGQEMRAGDEDLLCSVLWVLTVCNCRRYPRTPSSGPGTRDLWTPAEKQWCSVHAKWSVRAKGEEPCSQRAPSGMAGASKKCSKDGGKAASALPGSTQPGQRSCLGCRASEQPQSLTTTAPQVLSFSHFHFLQDREMFLYSNTKVFLARAAQNYQYPDNHALLVSPWSLLLSLAQLSCSREVESKHIRNTFINSIGPFRQIFSMNHT